jgi:S1-C subfamily serine protease
VIGINTAIYSPSGAYAGIGFAVPVDAVNRVAPQLIARGKYQRPSLGISVDDDISRAVAEELEIEGVMILKVQPGSAAEKAGLRGTRMGRGGEVTPGDVIQAVDGRPVKGVKELFSLLDQYRIGDQVKLRIWRDGRVAEASVVLQGEAR